LPGFLSGARYEAVKGGPKHLAVYELESVAALESDAYKRVRTNPTAWTKRCSPEVIGTTYIRNVYTLIHPKAVTPPVAESDMAPETQRIRPHMRHAPGSPGVYVKTFSL